MPSNYTGNPAAVQSPSPAPGPGVAPIIARPIDSEGGAASLYQPLDALTDYLAFISKSIRPSLPVVPVAGSAYTAVTYSSFGGTVTPSGTGFNLGRYYVIKIIAGGAVGVATFQTSLDGGATYGATQTTAASMTDATGGETLAFAGTLTINGTAAFQGAFTPQAEWLDQGGNIRHLVDHNGYPVGRRSEFRENWLGPNGTVNAGNPVNTAQNVGAMAQYGLPFWGLGVANAPTGITADVSFNGFNFYSAPAASMYMDPGTTNAAKLELFTNSALQLQTYHSFVMEWEAGLGAVGTNSQTAVMGLFGSIGVTAATTYLAFRKTSTDTNWQAATGNGSVTPVNSTVAPVANAVQRFRIEYHGSASPIGVAVGSAVAIFWVNETPTLITATLPTVANASLRFGFGILNTAGLGVVQPLVISPVYATWNRALNMAAL